MVPVACIEQAEDGTWSWRQDGDPWPHGGMPTATAALDDFLDYLSDQYYVSNGCDSIYSN